MQNLIGLRKRCLLLFIKVGELKIGMTKKKPFIEMSIIIHQSRRIKDWNDEKKKNPFHCLTVEIKDK